LLPDSSQSDPAKVLVVGIKQPVLAAQLANSLLSRHINVECAIDPLSRAEFLAKMNESSIIVALPFEMEGFYLPALEAMAMGKALVCPDCLGNRSFCHDKINCLMPSRHLESIEAAVLRLLANPALTRQLQEQAFIDSQSYRIDKERERFTQVLMSCQA
jgi:glycosyltransferase involved in cell wall biosynthesis